MLVSVQQCSSEGEIVPALTTINLGWSVHGLACSQHTFSAVDCSVFSRIYIDDLATRKVHAMVNE